MKFYTLLFVSLVICISCSKSERVKIQNDDDEAEDIESFQYNTSAGCFQTAIVGGEKIAKENLRSKYVVLLIIKTEDGGYSTCTGSLISRKTVLTAAHCLPPKMQKLQVVFHNSMRCSEGMNSKFIYNIDLRSIKSHPQWNENAHVKTEGAKNAANFDVGLIKLTAAAPVDYKPIQIATPEEIKTAEEFFQIGYGRINTRTVRVPELNEVAVSINNISYLNYSKYLLVS